MNRFIIADASKCIGCRTCEVACVVSHQENQDCAALTPKTFLPRIHVIKGVNVSTATACRQCEDAPCANVCPNGAISKCDDSVQVNQQKCIGCKACVVACPFGTMEIIVTPLDNSSVKASANKCDLCLTRPHGPACIENCPADVLSLATPAALENLANPDMLHAIWLTVLIALITVPVNLVFGTLLAWLVTRFNFPGRQLLLTLLDIPFAVSPVVAGLVYLLFYGSNGPLGGWLDAHNLQIMFAWPGMVLVTIFVTCPFVVRELVPVMLSQGSNEDEAAVLLGASGWQMFRRVTLPNIRWALLYGVVLTNARAIGEFGAVSVVSGSIRGETLSLPLQIELLQQDYNTIGAFTAAALLTLMAILTLFLKSVVQWRLENQEKRQHQEGNHEH